jgi:hypothetical protein
VQSNANDLSVGWYFFDSFTETLNRGGKVNFETSPGRSETNIGVSIGLEVIWKLVSEKKIIALIPETECKYLLEPWFSNFLCCIMRKNQDHVTFLLQACESHSSMSISGWKCFGMSGYSAWSCLCKRFIGSSSLREH